jgi:arylsulfatase A-like enzyme
VEAVKKAGLEKNTLILFTSDNGSPGYAGDPVLRGQDWHKVNAVTKKFGHLPNGKRRGVKGDIWEGGHRIPLIASWPGYIAKGTKSNALVSLTDLMATFIKITGASVPDEIGEDSFDFSPALLEKNPGKLPQWKLPRESMIQHAGDGTFAIRKGKWKLIMGQGSGGLSKVAGIEGENVKTPGQLYNLETDPYEKNNLYSQYPEVVRELNVLLDTHKTLGNSKTHTL